MIGWTASFIIGGAAALVGICSYAAVVRLAPRVSNVEIDVAGMREEIKDARTVLKVLDKKLEWYERQYLLSHPGQPLYDGEYPGNA